MPKFILAFHGTPDIKSPQEGQQMMQEWHAWNEGMRKNIVDEGHPVGISHTVHKDGIDENGGSNPLSGFTLVDAADMSAACKLAEGCPLVTKGWGSVEVAECMDMTMNG
ncbi:MAG: hypothetical protein AAF429_04625 [Pseudomonadota bacterium]